MSLKLYLIRTHQPACRISEFHQNHSSCIYRPVLPSPLQSWVSLTSCTLLPWHTTSYTALSSYFHFSIFPSTCIISASTHSSFHPYVTYQGQKIIILSSANLLINSGRMDHTSCTCRGVKNGQVHHSSVTYPSEIPRRFWLIAWEHIKKYYLRNAIHL